MEKLRKRQNDLYEKLKLTVTTEHSDDEEFEEKIDYKEEKFEEKIDCKKEELKEKKKRVKKNIPS